MKIENYEIKEKLFQGQRYSVYEAIKNNTELCALKVSEKKVVPDLSIIDLLGREYNFLKQIDSQYVVKALDIIDSKDFMVLVLEHINGKSIKSKIKTERFPVGQFIELALMITDGLAAIHKQGIIHKDINPNNIIWDPSTNSLKIIDFSISSNFNTKTSHSGNPEKLQGTLPYISPEQTGRMNRSVDQRTDFYSLGVTFYEMLTSNSPFGKRDPMEIVYAHLTHSPEPPHLVNENIPETLSQIIMKLLAKKPEERYQSAEGLKHDLEKSLIKLDYSSFKLGEKDFSGKLNIPEKLYGREKEIEQLRDAYQRVSKGAKEMILVAGYSGTGKTSIVNEIHQYIAKNNGYFISGKFDQLQKSVPYSAFIQALNQFCKLILTENREALAQWKKQIQEAVGDLGKVLTDIIPHLKSVIGRQAEVAEIGGDESRRRFNHVFQRFLREVSTEQHPLVIFIDDLQWADHASLALLQVLMEDKQNHYLLFIGAYRDNEVSASHPLMITLDDIQKQSLVYTIPIKNLSIENVREWLWDTLKTDENSGFDDVAELTDLVYEKTQGNAFFTIQFMENLYTRNLLQFDFISSRWIYDIKEIKKQNFTDNVVHLLVDKIRTLPVEAQEILKLAACIGNTFDLDVLSIISEKNKEEHEKTLEIFLIEHLIYQFQNAVYKFVHDRIHQAAYSLISDKDKKDLHLRIGRLMLKNFESLDSTTGSEYLDRNIFDIVNHLNIGSDLIENAQEKLQLASLNLKAAQNAKISGAYRLSANYVQTIMELLPSDCWNHHYDLILSAYNEAVQTSYLCGNFEEMEKFVDTILKSAHDISHTFTAYRYRSMGLVLVQNQPILAVECLLNIFNTLGIDIPKSPSRSETEQIYQKNELLLKEITIDSFKQMPMMNDSGKQLALRIFDNGILAFILGGEDAFPFTVNKMLELTLKHGLTPETPHVLSLVGMMKILWEDIPGAYKLGKIALSLSDEKFCEQVIPYRANLIAIYYLLGHKLHYKKLCKMLMDIYPQAMNAGDIESASSLLDNYIALMSRTDMYLSALYEKALSMRETATELKQSLVVANMECDILALESLLGKSSNPASLPCDVESLFKNVPGQAAHFCAIQGHLKKIMVAYLFENYDNMLDHIEAAEKRWNSLNIRIIHTRNDVYFYIPLAYMQLYTRSANENDKKTYLGRAEKRIKSMKEWANFGPINFLHKYYLLKAELCRVTGRSEQSAEYYDKAIEKAYENEYVNEAALANELAAKFYMQNQKDKLAALYFMEARTCYHRWGAIAKVKHLEKNYPKYLTMYVSASSMISSTTFSSSSETNGALLDIKSIIKASQTLSEEIQLNNLLEKMMQILIENAGAQKGVLIENKNEQMLIQAEGSTDGVSGILQALPAEESEKVPLSVTNYVIHSKQLVVFDNISKDINYSQDSYIKKNQPKSVVCSPILRKGALSSIIYLENNLVEGAFTPARLEILNMLSTQIAISIENAELYENLEETVKKRTIELEKTNNKLEESHKKIIDSVNYASRIQKAVLPNPENIAKFFPDHFLLNRPHSVVSGDFYWIKQIDNKIVVAVADCTGHGIPGALVSMLGMAFLNEIVPLLTLQSQLKAGDILNELRSKTKKALKQSGKLSDQQEGMDISLCIIDPVNSQLQYAGAYNPLYLIRDNQLIEIKGNRMPIGIHQKEKPFTTHDIQFKHKDIIYLFTDGFTDQLNEKGLKKFNKKRFKSLLVKINQEPMAKQKKLLIKQFEEWKGSFPQVDDILIFGIRF